ncbi:hypothetical protein GCM10011369_06000 [Neiella marina]|uniref:Uncharacterized protein n=1 Tax=Neiella marina TaxID=508461 RepID=A0A8J2U2R1_9GAMM|nr:hypothetical protein [Neiella marina]GGA67163.1 hypothetical protein GCM10011369_06000 [Neiella marina]
MRYQLFQDNLPIKFNSKFEDAINDAINHCGGTEGDPYRPLFMKLSSNDNTYSLRLEGSVYDSLVELHELCFSRFCNSEEQVLLVLSGEGNQELKLALELTELAEINTSKAALAHIDRWLITEFVKPVNNITKHDGLLDCHQDLRLPQKQHFRRGPISSM